MQLSNGEEEARAYPAWVSVRLEASLRAARAVGALSRASGRGGGTTLPGRVLDGLAPRGVEQLADSLALGSAAISATNGKTTTCAMVASILDPPIRLCSNAAGANLLSGIAAALVDGSGGGASAELGLFECDEAALPRIVRRVRPHTLALGNLFRDQLDRYGELEAVAERWRTMLLELPAETTLIACADDPLTADITSRHPHCVSYGIDDPELARGPIAHAADSRFCVRCGTPYEYEAVWFGHLGDYHCPGCGHARPELAISAAQVEQRALEAVSFELRTPLGSRTVELAVPGLYNVENALAASGVALALGASLDEIAAGLARFRPAFGRFQRIAFADREAVMLLIKNPAGANEALATLARGAGDHLHAMIALNDRIADGTDVSWIWDVDWELIAPALGSIVTAGTRASDIALRLKYAGIDASQITIEPDLTRALDATLEGVGAGGCAYLLPTYTAMLELQGVISKRGLAGRYWERSA
jgi:lipid II isoglutaminyl synthase (glutamine-hydrolysing)